MEVQSDASDVIYFQFQSIKLYLILRYYLKSWVFGDLQSFLWISDIKSTLIDYQHNQKEGEILNT